MFDRMVNKIAILKRPGTCYRRGWYKDIEERSVHVRIDRLVVCDVRTGIK